jgi:hypothetical protein
MDWILLTHERVERMIIFGYHKELGIDVSAEKLSPCQEGLYSVKRVT